MKDDADQMADMALEAARRAGATASDVIVSGRQSLGLEVRNGRLEDVRRAEGLEIGLRVFSGSSSAIISGHVDGRAGVEQLATRALAMARAAPPDPLTRLARRDEFAPPAPDLGIDSGMLPDVSALQNLAERAEAAALAVSGVARSGGSSASASRSFVTLATSEGFCGHYSRSGISFSATAIAGSGTGLERDYDWSGGVAPEDLDSPELIGQRAGERAVRRLNPQKLASTRLPVLFDRRVATSLVGHFLSAISGDAIVRGTSFLKDSLGTAVFSRAVSIHDTPGTQRGFATRPFDGEGLAGPALALIDGGMLTSWLLDLRSAQALGLAPNGRASRGLSSAPSPSSTNVVLAAGLQSVEAILGGIKRGLLVTEMIGSGVNGVTGDYSRGASGFLIENGEVAGPVSEITLAGNLKEMFGTLVPADDLKITSSLASPSLLVEEMTLAGR